MEVDQVGVQAASLLDDVCGQGTTLRVERPLRREYGNCLHSDATSRPLLTGWSVHCDALHGAHQHISCMYDARSTRTGRLSVMHSTGRPVVTGPQRLIAHAHLARRKVLYHACGGTAYCQAGRTPRRARRQLASGWTAAPNNTAGRLALCSMTERVALPGRSYARCRARSPCTGASSPSQSSSGSRTPSMRSGPVARRLRFMMNVCCLSGPTVAGSGRLCASTG